MLQLVDYVSFVGSCERGEQSVSDDRTRALSRLSTEQLSICTAIPALEHDVPRPRRRQTPNRYRVPAATVRSPSTACMSIICSASSAPSLRGRRTTQPACAHWRAPRVQLGPTRPYGLRRFAGTFRQCGARESATRAIGRVKKAALCLDAARGLASAFAAAVRHRSHPRLTTIRHPAQSGATRRLTAFQIFGCHS